MLIGAPKARPLAIAGLLALLAPVAADPVRAVPPDVPKADRVWGGCVLDSVTQVNLAAVLDDQVEPDVENNIEVGFIVVYALNNANDGQELGAGFTGPILCRAFEGVAVEKATETQPIPASGAVDILSAEEAFILQYEVNPPGPIEKRFCHSAATNTDCFRIRSEESEP